MLTIYLKDLKKNTSERTTVLMKSIELTDNNIEQQKAETFDRKDVSALFPIASKNIAELCQDNEGLLIFPHSINTSDDKIGESSIINIQNTDDPEKVRIVTGNIMGFIGVDGVQVTIIFFIICCKECFRSTCSTLVTTMSRKKCLTF